MDLDALVAALRVDARWSAAEVDSTNEGLEVRRGRARVLLVNGARIVDEPELVLRAVRGDFGLLLLGEAPTGLKELLKPGSAVAVLDDGADGDQAFLAID